MYTCTELVADVVKCFICKTLLYLYKKRNTEGGFTVGIAKDPLAPFFVIVIYEIACRIFKSHHVKFWQECDIQQGTFNFWTLVIPKKGNIIQSREPLIPTPRWH